MYVLIISLPVLLKVSVAFSSSFKSFFEIEMYKNIKHDLQKHGEILHHVINCSPVDADTKKILVIKIITLLNELECVLA